MSDEDIEKLVQFYAKDRTEKNQVLVRTFLQKDRSKVQSLLDAWENSEEKWKDLSEVFPEGKDVLQGYKVSTMGQFENKNGDPMKGNMIESGYLRVRIGEEKWRKPSHRYVALAFLPRVEGKDVVHHINGLPFDNRVANLQWVTDAENSQAAWEDGGGNQKRLRSIRELDEDGNVIATYKSIVEASEKSGITVSSIQRVCSKGLRKTQGHYFEYDENDENKREPKPKKSYGGQPVGLFNVKTGEMVRGPFNSITETGVNNISSYIKKGRITKAGCQWRKIEKKDDEKSDEKWVQFRNTTYMVSNTGRVKDNKGNNRKTYPSAQGEYHKITLVIDGEIKVMQLSRVVAEAFIPLPAGYTIDELQVDHINRKTLDNRVENLRWLTREENARAANEKPVLQIDLDGNIIKRFRSVTEAAKHFDVTTGNISASCTKRVKCCQNFFFRYDDGTYTEEEKQYILDVTCVGQNRIVQQFDMEGNTVKRWLSTKDVAVFCNISYQAMRLRIKKGIEVAGFLWKYADEL